jgi:hypothetical protein
MKETTKWRQIKIKRTPKKYRSAFRASSFGSKTIGEKISPPQLSTTGKNFSASASVTSTSTKREPTLKKRV